MVSDGIEFSVMSIRKVFHMKIPGKKTTDWFIQYYTVSEAITSDWLEFYLLLRFQSFWLFLEFLE